MNGFWTEVLKRYGTPAVALGVVMAFVVWGLAHTASAPGGEVSVLWGLVKYTKKPLSAVTPITVSKESSTNPPGPELTTSSQRVTGAQSPSINLLLRTGIRQENVDEVLRALRSERGLRELTSAESGRPVHEIPSGTYFYYLGRWLDSETVFRDGTTVNDFAGPFNRRSASRYRGQFPDAYAEVHYPRDEEPHLILFLNDFAASTVAKLPGNQPREVIASITPWDSATALVSVPISRIVRSRTRDAEVSKEDSLVLLDMLLQ